MNQSKSLKASSVMPVSAVAFALSVAISASAVGGATAGGGPTTEDIDDMGPYDRSVVTSFWDCRSHHCNVVRAWSSDGAIDAAGSVSEAVPIDSLEPRVSVSDVSDTFDFSTSGPGFVIILR